MVMKDILLDLEKNILSVFLIDPDVLSEIELSPDDFGYEIHRKIFRTMMSLRESGKEISPFSVMKAMQADKKEFEYIIDLPARFISASNIKADVETLKEISLERKLQNAMFNLREFLKSNPDSQEIADFVEKQFSIEQKTKDLPDPQAILEYVSKISHNDFTRISGYSTGYPSLDKYTGGFKPGNLVILAGRPGMGKTTFAVNLICNLCAKQIPTIFFSAEMTRFEIVKKILSRTFDIHYSILRESIVNSFELDLIESLDFREYFPLKIYDTGAPKLSQISSAIREMKKKSKIPPVIFIDHLGKISRPKANSTNDAIGEITWKLKSMAKEYYVPIVLLSQLNRAVESRRNKRPQLSDLRDSGNIEQDADEVLFLYRPAYYDKNRSDELEVIIAKQRNGITGTVKLKTDLKFNKVIEPES